MSRVEVANLVEQASSAGRIVGVRLPLDDDDDEPWMAPPSRRKAEQPIVGQMPERVEVVLAIKCTSTGARCRQRLSIV